MVITWIDGRGLVVAAEDAMVARQEAERWLLDGGAQAIRVAQLDVPRAPVREAGWTGVELVDVEQDGAQAVTVVDIPAPGAV